MGAIYYYTIITIPPTPTNFQRYKSNAYVMENTANNFGFGKLALECMSCTPTEKADGFILKLQHTHMLEKVTPFGKKVQPVQKTFYMKTAEQCEIGFTADMNLDEWRITERPFDIVDGDAVTPVMLKWLHIGA